MLKVLACIPDDQNIIETDLEHMDRKRGLAHLIIKLLSVQRRGRQRWSSKTTEEKLQALAAAVSKNPWDPRAVVCCSCDNCGHLKNDCPKKKDDDVTGHKKPSRRRRDC